MKMNRILYSRLIIVIVLSLASLATLAFSQNITPAQMAQIQQAQTGQQRSLTAAEIAAARDVLAKENKQTFWTDSLNSLKTRKKDSLTFLLDSLNLLGLDSLYLDSINKFLDSSLFKKDTLARYEKIVFSQSLPSVFYQIQGVVPADYPLKPGDNLELSLWGAVERQLVLSVNNQGNVFVEGAGLVNVANLTLGEAEKAITKKLQSVYSGIGQGRISVNLRTMNLSPTKVFVVGFVQRPGGYDLPGNANVFLALYRAGGPDNIGSVRNLVIRRANGDSAKIDLYDFLLKGKRAGEGILRDGDLIFVPKAEKLVKATGTIGRPAIYELKEGETIKDLLHYAGNLLPNADHTVTLWRLSEKGVSRVFEPGIARDIVNNKIDSSKAFQMQDGDSVFVFASTRPNDNSIEVAGSVFYPGFYTWSNDMGVKEAAALAGGLSPEAFTERAIVQRLNPDSSFSYYDDDFENTLGLKLLPNDKVIILDTRILKNWRTVSVAGYVKNPGEFEWQDGINALDLIVMCGGYLPNASKDEIIIERIIPGQLATKSIRLPIKKGLSVDHNKDLILEPGDRVVVLIEDSFYEHEVVALSGAFTNPGSYSLAFRGETFKKFMNRVAGIDSAAYVKGGRFFRKTTITRKDMLDSIITIDTNYRINYDVEKVLQGKEKDIPLQAGDSIFIPFDVPTVNITGEVVGPGHVLWQKGWNVVDYVNAAGGLTINGDEDRIVLIYANGQKTKSNMAKREPDPGSEINVSFKPVPEPTKMSEIVAVVGGIVTALATITTLVITVLK
jgi:protein involved in polysaccharide export with SLBB domain